MVVDHFSNELTLFENIPETNENEGSEKAA